MAKYTEIIIVDLAVSGEGAIGKKIEIARSLRRKTQAEIANKLGISQASLSRLESGLGGGEELKKTVAEYLGINLSSPKIEVVISGNFRQIVAAKILISRRVLGLSQDELADLTCYRRSAIARIESAGTQDAEVIRLFERVMGLDFGFLEPQILF